MKNVTLDADPEKPGTFLARSNETGEVVARGGRVDTYDLYPQPDGTVKGNFSFWGFRKVQEETPEELLSEGYALYFYFFGHPCILRPRPKINLVLGFQGTVNDDAQLTSCELMTRVDDQTVRLYNFVIELSNGGSFQIAHGVFCKGNFFTRLFFEDV